MYTIAYRVCKPTLQQRLTRLAHILFFSLLTALLPLSSTAQVLQLGGEWPDSEGRHVNAHGGCVLRAGDRYYWFGEERPVKGEKYQQGVTCYSSTDLCNWRYEGLALRVDDHSKAPLDAGCTIERPKVVYCSKTGQYVLWFHLELKGKGYAAAQCAVAVSKNVTGPYQLLRAGRVNAGYYPMDMTKKEQQTTFCEDSLKEWWTPQWFDAIKKGYFMFRDRTGGQMSRDMTVFVDDDGKAYHVYSSEDNLTLHIAELSDDYTRHTGRYIRVAPAGHNEAPTVFKHNGTYWMITSGCTGWAPNEARMFSAPSIWGPWTQHPSPFVGTDAKKTFGGQGTFVFQPAAGKFLFMADIWNPNDLAHSGYFWLPIDFDAANTPVINRQDRYSLGDFLAK